MTPATAADATAPPRTVALSLVAHTNVGKTTLARTLLGRDIGEVRDEAHVTLEAERHTMVESPAGDRLELWDTPGFGDSTRLAKRLAQAGNPIGWFLDQVWDRLRDRAMWSSQRAVRNILDQADVVLYLVNAAEAPEDAAYLDAELQVLTLLAKPVVVLLNQLGPPLQPADEAAERARWQARLQAAACVRQVLALDAFARCWVQERALLDAVHAALDAEARPAFARLQAAWTARSLATWRAAMAELAARLARAARDRETVGASGVGERLHDLGRQLGLGRSDGTASDSARAKAMRRLAERLDAETRASTDRLIRLHGLEGHAAAHVLERLATHYAVRAPLDTGKAALWGGAVAGALAGLKADVASGGITLGGGMLAGSVLGALGAAGLARGVNLVRGVEVPTIAWSEEALDAMVRAALLGYLAVAHYGRGRGEWVESESPAHWAGVVAGVVEAEREGLHAVWERRSEGDDADGGDALTAGLQESREGAGRSVLERLCPRAVGAMPGL